MASNTNTSKKTVTLTTTAILTAILIVMAFTPLGYLKTPFLSISFLAIPVAIGAITLGPAVGAWLGFVFGLTSFAQCFMGDAIGTVLIGISPLRAFIVCVIPRILVGLLSGLIFVGLNKILGRISSGSLIACIVSSVGAAVINTILFLSTMALLFYPTLNGMSEGKGVFQLMLTWAGVNAIFEAIACGIISTAIGAALHAVFKKLNIAK